MEATLHRSGMIVSDVLTLGVDLGGTKVLTALVDGQGNIVASEQHPTDAGKGPDGVVADIVACVRGCLDKTPDGGSALGIGVAGQVDATSGTVNFALNLGWRDVPLGLKLEAALGVPVIVANDVRAAAWGEWLHGAGRGVSDLVTVFIGTGVGGAVIEDDRMIKGCGNAAGELGHVTVVARGRQCRCPNRGCLEAYVGGWAIAERAQEVAEADPVGARALVELSGSPTAVTATTVTEAYRMQDPLATDLVEGTADYLIAGAVGLVNAFNPCRLILGGGVIEGLPELVGAVEKGVREWALPTNREGVNVVKAALAGNAGVVGSAALARQFAGRPAKQGGAGGRAKLHRRARLAAEVEGTCENAKVKDTAMEPSTTPRSEVSGREELPMGRADNEPT